MVAAIRETEMAIGTQRRPLLEGDDMRNLIRRSVTAFTDISKGELIRAEMLAIKRPGIGIQPTNIDKVVGRRAARQICADETLKWEDLAD